MSAVGFTLRLCQFAIMFFVKGRWQAVDYLGQVSMSSKEDAALNLIIDLSMSTKIWSLKNEECKKESEEQAAEHIARCVEGLRIESRKWMVSFLPCVFHHEANFGEHIKLLCVLSKLHTF